MLVVDANILVYSLVDSPLQSLIRDIRKRDDDWRAPELCLHEILNVLTTFHRQGLLSLAQCQEALRRAMAFMELAAVEVDLQESLNLAAAYQVSGHDAQYIQLARSLEVPLITEDRKLREAVPEHAISGQEFLAKNR